MRVVGNNKTNHWQKSYHCKKNTLYTKNGPYRGPYNGWRLAVNHLFSPSKISIVSLTKKICAIGCNYIALEQIAKACRLLPFAKQCICCQKLFM